MRELGFYCKLKVDLYLANLNCDFPRLLALLGDLCQLIGKHDLPATDLAS